MRGTSLFDIVGPIMVGPSSSHTAGAVRLGLLAKNIYANESDQIEFTLYNSFTDTGKGHGTDKALVAGVLGLKIDDMGIKDSFKKAKKLGIDIRFKHKTAAHRHPNSVDIRFINKGNSFYVSGNSIGAGEIEVIAINDFKVHLSGDLPTLVIIHKDRKGIISEVSKLIQSENINIASLHLDRTEKNQEASMIATLDSALSDDVVKQIRNMTDVYLVRNIKPIKLLG